MDPNIINVASLEKELKTALELEEKYQRENNAKLRTIQQKVCSYEEFRNIVLASHLKPLDKKDKTNSLSNKNWNRLYSTSHKQNHVDCEVVESGASELKPGTASEFYQKWRILKGTEKYDFLLSLGGEHLQQMFISEIGLGLLGEFLSVLADSFKPEDAEKVVAVLEGLSHTGRFSLSLSFLDKTEKNSCLKLFQMLLDGCGLTGDSASSENVETKIVESGKSSYSPAEGRLVTMGNREKLTGLMHLYDIHSELL